MHVVVSSSLLLGLGLLVDNLWVKLLACSQVYLELYSGGQQWCEEFMFFGQWWYLNPNSFIANIFIVA